MTSYPLPTLAASVSPTGISAPAYADIYASLQATFQSIYGSDAYIDPDSQDGQMLAIFAQAQSDSNQQTIATYNAYSPTYAQGAGLSSVVKINGLQREISSNSTADVTITGTVGTVITNGIIQDTNGNQWNLASPLTIPGSGILTATATCAVTGAITSGPGTITGIVTAVLGFQSVTNGAAAVPGAPVETDAALRARQAVSTSLPAISVVAAIYGALANLPDVQEVMIFENDTGLVNSLLIPPHSIACVVNGGDATEICTTIEQKKTPGTGTYGTTTEVIIDTVGVPVTINFFVPTQITIIVDITINPLLGYTSSTGSAIIASIVAYINGLGIYANNGLIAISSLTAAAYNTPYPNTYNVTSLTAAVSPATPMAADLSIAFNQIPICSTANVTLIT